jgi:hypothetical protein
MNKNIGVFILLLGSAFVFSTSHPIVPFSLSVKETLAKGVEFSKKVIIKSAVALLFHATSVTAHEMGHAATAKWLWNAPLTVTLGSSNYYGSGIHIEKNLLQYIKNVVIGAGGIAFVDSQLLAQATKPQQAIFFAAGPFAGVFAALLLGALLHTVMPEKIANTDYDKHYLLNYGSMTTIYSNLVNFIPFRVSGIEVSDGAQIGRVYGFLDSASSLPCPYSKLCLDFLVINYIRTWASVR